MTDKEIREAIREGLLDDLSAQMDIEDEAYRRLVDFFEKSPDFEKDLDGLVEEVRDFNKDLREEIADDPSLFRYGIDLPEWPIIYYRATADASNIFLAYFGSISFYQGHSMSWYPVHITTPYPLDLGVDESDVEYICRRLPEGVKLCSSCLTRVRMRDDTLCRVCHDEQFGAETDIKITLDAARRELEDLPNYFDDWTKEDVNRVMEKFLQEVDEVLWDDWHDRFSDIQADILDGKMEEPYTGSDVLVFRDGKVVCGSPHRHSMEGAYGYRIPLPPELWDLLKKMKD